MATLIRRSVFALFWIALGFDLVAFGGLMHDTSVSPALLKAARKEAPLVLTWMSSGGWLVGVANLDGWAREVADGQFAHAYEPLRERPEVAIEMLFEHMALPARLAHPAPPFLLLAWALLWWLRPRQVSTIRRR